MAAGFYKAKSGKKRPIVRVKATARKSGVGLKQPIDDNGGHRAKSAKLVYAMRGGSLGLTDDTTAKVIARVSEGFPFRFLGNFQKSTALSLETISTAVRIPARTLSRRKARGRLQPDESERLLRLSTVFEQAVTLFDGNRSAALRWLQTPQPALAGVTPLDFCQTEIGAAEVRDLIGRLGHGVYT